MLGIQADSRLIEYEEIGLVQRGAYDVEQAAPASGEAVSRGCGIGAEAVSGYSLGHRVTGSPAGETGEPCREQKILPNV
jgi:hypothetical protein